MNGGGQYSKRADLKLIAGRQTVVAYTKRQPRHEWEFAMDNYVAKILSARRASETSRFSLHVPNRLIRTLRTKVHPGSSPTPVA
jgi:hypothetical protein